MCIGSGLDMVTLEVTVMANQPILVPEAHQLHQVIDQRRHQAEPQGVYSI